MSWKDKLQDASFRGVPFKVQSADAEFGRRNQVHEYPFRDQPFSEDLGKKARKYTFNAYFVGDNYIAERDRLVKAIESDPTPGTLVHPTLGTLKVVPQVCTANFSNREGGIEFLTLSFVEAGEKKFPTANTSLSSQVSFKSDALVSASLSDFNSKFKTTGYIDEVTSQAKALVNQAVGIIDDSVSVGKVTDPFFSVFKGTLSKFKNTLSSIIAIPGSLSSGIQDLIQLASTVFTSPEEIIRYQKKVFNFGDALLEVSGTTPTLKQIASNQEAVIDLVKSLAVGEMAVAVSQSTLTSRQEAILLRDEVDESLESLIFRAGDNGNDTIYLAVEELRTAVIRSIHTRAIALPNLVKIKTKDPIPALVFAYDLYEDATQDQEVIDRNRIENPLFIPGGAEMEVLR